MGWGWGVESKGGRVEVLFVVELLTAMSDVYLTSSEKGRGGKRYRIGRVGEPWWIS